MAAPKIFESEYRFCLLLWDHEPVNSTRLVALCKEQLGWSKATTYTVIRRLEENLHAYRIALDNRDRERLHAKLTYSSNRKRRINLPGSGQIPLPKDGSAKG